MNTQINLSDLPDELIAAEMGKRTNKKQNDRQAYKELVEETVTGALVSLSAASQALSEAKTQAFKRFESILQMKAEVYGVKEGQQTHTFSSEAGDLTIGFRINDGWDDTVNAGIAKVKKFLSSLAKDDATAQLVDVVFGLLKKDKNGNLKGSRVLELKSLVKEFKNPDFEDGVNIIAEAYKPKQSVWFIEANLNDNGNKLPIPLAMSSVPFTSGYSFNFYSTSENENESKEK